LAMSAALTGNRAIDAARQRLAYANWKAGLVAGVQNATPLVSRVILGTDNVDGLLASLHSVYAQSYKVLEIIVASGDRSVETQLAACPFPYQIVVADSLDLAALLNTGVRQSAGQFISPLVSGDLYHPERIAKLVDGIACRGGQWGFSALADRLTNQVPASFSAILGEDTTGFALLGSANLVGSASNLFLSRELFEKLDGFESSSGPMEEHFALKAVLEAEPFFVEAALCHCLTVPIDTLRSSDTKSGALQQFYGRITQIGPDAQTHFFGNPFAPVPSVWDLQFVCRVGVLNHLPYLSETMLQCFVSRGIEAQAAMALKNQELNPGLDLVSFFSGEMGLAESARGIAQSCHAGAIPFGLRSVDLNLSQRCADRSMDPWLHDQCSHAAVVLMVNPDVLKNILPQLGQNEIAGRYRIGYWYWETEQLPEQWRYALEQLDEIWVATEFVAQAMRKFTNKPVTKIRPPIKVELSRQYERVEFGVAKERFLFLFSFDFGSFSARKNPDAAILAFQQAFPLDRQDVGLIIKSHGGANWPEKLLELQQQIARDPRIVLIDRLMTRDQVFGLQSVCDVFVSLHRSEGLGLGLAECMAQGKAVIGTAYSGNLEFMSDENSCLVDCDMIAIAKGQYLYDQPNVSWAEPHIAQAAWYMAKLADDKMYYRQKADAGQQTILNHWNLQSTASAIRQRLNQLNLLDQS
ncbi:MAG: glycosyltransferase, partial [Pseudomonadota bacterium]